MVAFIIKLKIDALRQDLTDGGVKYLDLLSRPLYFGVLRCVATREAGQIGFERGLSDRQLSQGECEFASVRGTHGKQPLGGLSESG